MSKPLALDQHQKEAVNKLTRGKILVGGVGSGKTRTALAWAYSRICGGTIATNETETWKKPTNPKDIYVFTTAKKRDHLDWDFEALDFGISTKSEFSYSGITLHVDSYNMIQKYVHIKNVIVIFDEQKLIGNGAWVKAFYKIASQNTWILLSATPGDVWMDYVPVFVANGFFSNRTSFIRQHVVYNHHANFPKIDRYIDTESLYIYRNKLLVELPSIRHTTRHVEHVVCPYDIQQYDRVWNKRWNPYTDAPIKDLSELFVTVRKVVNTDQTRLEEIRNLLDQHPRLIVFYNFNYELDILRTLGKEFVVAEWNGHKHEPVPTTDRWVYLVQYLAGAEAWECTTTNAMAFYSLTYSHRQFEQAQGRIDRRNTKYSDLYYYVLKSYSEIDSAVWSSVKKKKNFSESAFVKKKNIVFEP